MKQLVLASQRTVRLAAASAVALFGLSACIVPPVSQRGAYGAYGGDEVVVEANLAPPAPYSEVIPVAPYPGAVWIGGYWGWSGGRHQWSPGRWTQPRPGYRWQARRWEPAARGGWALRGGYWAR